MAAVVVGFKDPVGADQHVGAAQFVDHVGLDELHIAQASRNAAGPVQQAQGDVPLCIVTGLMGLGEIRAHGDLEVGPDDCGAGYLKAPICPQSDEFIRAINRISRKKRYRV